MPRNVHTERYVAQLQSDLAQPQQEERELLPRKQQLARARNWFDKCANTREKQKITITAAEKAVEEAQATLAVARSNFDEYTTTLHWLLQIYHLSLGIHPQQEQQELRSSVAFGSQVDTQQ